MDTLPSLEVKHAHARLELRERQLQELAGTMSELSTEEVWIFLLKKCFVLSACYASSLHCFHLLKSKTTPMYSVLKWKSRLLHLCDDTPQTPAWLKLLRFSFALSRVACFTLFVCYTFASMSKGCIVYHSFHELHILWRFKLILFLRSLLTVPWNTMYNKAILVFSLYGRSWSKTTRRKPSVPHKQPKNIATKPCLKWRRRSTE